MAMGSLPNMEETPSLGSRISTVVPATPRGEQNGAYQLRYMDLLMKLHYIRAVYFFSAEAVQGLSAYDLKKPMFPLLDPYSHLSGRIRRSESGRPFIKCNDAGVRIAESHCEKTLQEWLHQNGYSIDGLVHDHVLGPDLGFSPLVFLTFTWFKDGGLCVGLSWAHALGDASSAFNFITTWSQLLAGQVPPKSLHMPNAIEPESLSNSSVSEKNPVSVKRATIVEEYWLDPGDSEVVAHSFHVTSKQLDHLVTASTSTCGQNHTTKTSYFEILSALVWKSIAKIKEDSGLVGPKAVTICTNSTVNRRENEFPSNYGLVFSLVEANLDVGESDILELAKLIAEKKIVENRAMEKLVEEEDGKEDFIVYGVNLTFVDLEECNIYGVKLNGQKPIQANCSFRGVGDQGVVLVLPAPEDKEDGGGGGGDGRMITVSLPEKELDQLKDKLVEEWGIV